MFLISSAMSQRLQRKATAGDQRRRLLHAIDAVFCPFPSVLSRSSCQSFHSAVVVLKGQRSIEWGKQWEIGEGREFEFVAIVDGAGNSSFRQEATEKRKGSRLAKL